MATNGQSTDQQGLIIWLTGLSGAGKTTLARALSDKFQSDGRRVEVLDGDEVRENLSRGLGFSKEDRNTNVLRIGFVARLLARNGVIVLAAAISPFRQSRDDARLGAESDGVRFIEVFVRCPVERLVERDVKGLYMKALAGEIKNFTGISDPYEEPLAPDIIVNSSEEQIEESAAKILSHIARSPADGRRAGRRSNTRIERGMRCEMSGIEEIKRRKDGLDVLGDIYRYARLGPAAITPDDEALLKWYGIYTQRPAEDGYFMVRIRIPGGDLTPAQLRVIAELSAEHGRGLADITVRQNVQLHWVRIENMPEVLDRLKGVGLSTTEACGDCVRNIINCPVSGADHNELYDTTELVHRVTSYFIDNRDFSNLPRKFKIAITGCALRCVYPEINDIGLFAVREGDGVRFRARIGGGLSTTPRFSKDLGVLIEPDEVVDLCAAVAAVFRDEGNRNNRKRARLKFLVEQWEIPRFREEVEARLGRKLYRAANADADPVARGDRSHLGIHRQRQPGLNYIGLGVLGGRTSSAQLAAACRHGGKPRRPYSDHERAEHNPARHR